MATVYICKHTIARTVDGVRVNYPPKTKVPSKGIPAFTKDELERLKKLDAIEAEVAAAASDDAGDDAGDGDAVKAALLARAKELGVGGVNKNWGVDKLKAAVEKAEAEAAKDGDDGL